MIALANSIGGYFTSGASASTSTVTTSFTGSTFYVSLVSASANPVTLSDTMGNSYTQIGTTASDSNGRWISRYFSYNGVGGPGHGVHAAQSASLPLSIFFAEITGTTLYMTDGSGGGLYTDSTSATTDSITYTTDGASVVLPLDQSNTNTSSFASEPFSSGSITITPATGGEILLSTYSSEAFVQTISYSEANGFTINQAQTSHPGNSTYNNSAFASKVVTQPGTYNASWSDSTGNSTSQIAVIDSFNGATFSNSAILAWYIH